MSPPLPSLVPFDLPLLAFLRLLRLPESIVPVRWENNRAVVYLFPGQWPPVSLAGSQAMRGIFTPQELANATS